MKTIKLFAVFAACLTAFSLNAFAAEKTAVYCDDTTCAKVTFRVADSAAVYEGKTKMLTVFADRKADYKVKYQSSDISVVRVTKNGSFTGISSGNATIKTTISGSHLSPTCEFKTKISVKKPSIRLSCNQKKVGIGKKLRIKAISKGVDGKLRWSVSNKKLAQISSKGVLKGKKTGSVKVTAACGKYKGTIKIKVVR